MRLRVCLALLVTLSIHAGVAANAGSGPTGYRAPVERDGMVFPVARSNWYSVINFVRDWHAPRMRLIGGEWVQVGVHEGNDIFAEPRTPVRAIASGTVERSGWLFYSGWRIGIRGDDGRYWFYAHLAEPPSVSLDQRVEAGQNIGLVGNTGYDQTPGHKDEFLAHLHVGIQEPSGEWINPHPLMKRLYEEAQSR